MPAWGTTIKRPVSSAPAFLIDFYRNRDLYKWVTIEAEDEAFRSIEDVVACTPDGLFDLSKVKFTSDPNSLEQSLSQRLALIAQSHRSICPGPSGAATRACALRRSFACQVPGPALGCCRPRANHAQVLRRQGSIRNTKPHTAMLSGNRNAEPALAAI